MPTFATPSFLRRRSETYSQFSALIRAGVTLIQTVETLRKSPADRADRPHLQELGELLQQGYTFSQALARLGPWIAPLDQALLQAGEESGRLDACFEVLADYYKHQASLLNRLLKAMMYPAFLLHFAILLFPLNLLTDMVWKGLAMPWLIQKVAILLPLWAIILTVMWLTQGTRGLGVRSFLEQLGRLVPYLGKARRDIALSRLSMAMESQLSAGVPILQAWQLAGQACGSPALEKEIGGWPAKFDAGIMPAEAVAASKLFPDTFSSLYVTGETSGQLDDTLKRLQIYYEESGSHNLEMYNGFLSKGTYFGIVLFVAFKILGFYTGYFKQVEEVLQ